MANSKISVENLNLHYGENHALKDVNMEIAVSYRITCNNGNQRTLINP